MIKLSIVIARWGSGRQSHLTYSRLPPKTYSRHLPPLVKEFKEVEIKGSRKDFLKGIVHTQMLAQAILGEISAVIYSRSSVL